MRRYITVLAAVSILLIAVLVFSTVAVAAEKPGFFGAWEATDPADGSDYTMQIRGGGNGQYRVILQDSVCSGCGASQPKCKAIGQGTIISGELNTELTVYAMGCPSCSCHGTNVKPVFTYNSSSDTINGLGTTWNRVERP